MIMAEFRDNITTLNAKSTEINKELETRIENSI